MAEEILEEVEEKEGYFVEVDKEGYCTGRLNVVLAGGVINHVYSENLPEDFEDVLKFKSYHVQTDSDKNVTAFEFDKNKYKHYIDMEQQKANEDKIAEMKKQLFDTDYQVIKCYECSLAEVELPYDITALHKERQQMRDRINELEAKTVELKG